MVFLIDNPLKNHNMLQFQEHDEQIAQATAQFEEQISNLKKQIRAQNFFITPKDKTRRKDPNPFLL